MDDWKPMETAPWDDGWVGPCLLGKMQSWGWETWVGQCDDHDIWLVRLGNGSCDESEPPTHWMPLPKPPAL